MLKINKRVRIPINVPESDIKRAKRALRQTLFRRYTCRRISPNMLLHIFAAHREPLRLREIARSLARARARARLVITAFKPAMILPGVVRESSPGRSFEISSFAELFRTESRQALAPSRQQYIAAPCTHVYTVLHRRSVRPGASLRIDTFSASRRRLLSEVTRNCGRGDDVRAFTRRATFPSRAKGREGRPLSRQTPRLQHTRAHMHTPGAATAGTDVCY